MTFLEAAATHGHQGNGPSSEAFKCLENALETLTDPDNPEYNELSAGFQKMLGKLSGKKEVKGTKCVTEAMVNVAIAQHVLLTLTSGYAILDKDHSRNLTNHSRVFPPQAFGFTGLGLGK